VSSVAPPITIRPFTADEIPTCSRIFYEAFNDLHAGRGLPTEDPADDAWIRTALIRGRRTDPGLAMIAVDDDGPAAFGTAARRDDFWFLSFLFVLPRAQGRGIGHALLEALLPPPAERPGVRLATMVETIQPVSTGLYTSFGMAPRTPNFTLKGLQDPARLPALPPGVRATPLTHELLETCADLNRTMLGFVRPQDMAMWIDDATTATAYLRADGSVAAYGFIDDEGWTSPIASTDEVVSAAIVRDLLEGRDRPQDAKIGVLGWSGTLLAALLGAGMRMDPYPYVYCSSDAARPHPAYVPYAAFLV
jgi:GNAT superfamily N-acetyltransferase